MISKASSAAVQNQLILFLLAAKFSISYLDGHNLMTVGRCVNAHCAQNDKAHWEIKADHILKISI